METQENTRSGRKLGGSRLPSLTSGTNRQVKSETEKIMNKNTFTKNTVIKEKIDKCDTDSIDIMNIIDLSVLQMADPSFFQQYERIVKDMVVVVQDKASKDIEITETLTKLRKDPTNQDLKRSVFLAIHGIFVQLGVSKETNLLTNYDSIDRKIIEVMTVNEIVGLSVLEPLFKDVKIREIICNGPYDVQVEINGKIQKVPGCRFRDKDHLQELITKLFNAVNKTLAPTHPLERARLHDNSRVFAVHETVAPDGPNLNIRRHTDDWVSPNFLLKTGMADEEILTWLGNKINQGLSILVSGATSTGKTTLLGALSGFYDNDKRIVTVERNIELKLCPTKLTSASMEVIPPKPGTAQSRGITMTDLVEATTQMRPDVIIVGETTGPEAYDLLNALNSGHAGATTIHANGAEDAIHRLVTLTSMSDLVKGKAVLELISAAFDLVVTITRFPQDGSRKITGIYEINKEPKEDGGIIRLGVTPIWEFHPDKINEEHKIKGLNEVTKVTGHWEKAKDENGNERDLSAYRRHKHNLDITNDKTWDELLRLTEKQD